MDPSLVKYRENESKGEYWRQKYSKKKWHGEIEKMGWGRINKHKKYMKKPDGNYDPAYKSKMI